MPSRIYSETGLKEFPKICTSPSVCYPKAPQGFTPTFGFQELHKLHAETHLHELGIWLAPYINAFKNGVRLDVNTSKQYGNLMRINRGSYPTHLGNVKGLGSRSYCVCCQVKWDTHPKFLKCF